MNILFLCAAALAIGILSDIKTQAQPAVEAWVQTYHGLAESDDRPQKMALDSSGNVFVVGFSDAGVSGSDWLILKYSGVGVPLWTNRYTWPDKSFLRANALTVDRNDDVVLTGYSYDNGGDYLDCLTIKYSGLGAPLWTNRYDVGTPHLEFGRVALVHATAVDSSGNVFVALNSVIFAYSRAGATLWTNRYPGAAATGVALDGNGNVIVTGYPGNGEAYHDYVTVKYSGAGVPWWTNRYIACGYGYGYGIAVDGSNNVFVTGSSCGDYATIAYSSAGLPLWTNRYDGPENGFSIATAIAVDSNGSVVVTGSSTSNFNADSDYVTIKYSGAGVPLWTNRYNGLASGDDRAYAVAVDGSGNVFVTGESWNGSSFDYVTIKYSSAGAPLVSIARTRTNTVVVSWPSPATAFSLQQNTNGIGTLNWSDVVTTPTDDGTTRTVLLNPLAESVFYRLIHSDLPAVTFAR